MYRHPRVSLINLLFSELFKALKRFFKWLFVLAVFAACTSKPKQTPLEAAMLQHGKALMLEKGVKYNPDYNLFYDTLTEAGVIRMKAQQLGIAMMEHCSLGPNQNIAACDRLKGIADSLRTLASQKDDKTPVAYYCQLYMRVEGKEEHKQRLEFFVDTNKQLIRYEQFYRDTYGEPSLQNLTGYLR